MFVSPSPPSSPSRFALPSLHRRGDPRERRPFPRRLLSCRHRRCRPERLRDRLGPLRIGIAIGLFFATKYTAFLTAPLFLLVIDSPFRAQWTISQMAHLGRLRFSNRRAVVSEKPHPHRQPPLPRNPLPRRPPNPQRSFHLRSQHRNAHPRRRMDGSHRRLHRPRPHIRCVTNPRLARRDSSHLQNRPSRSSHSSLSRLAPRSD